MPAPKLVDLTRRACIRNIRDIDSFYDLPYEVVRPILLKLENPDQLARLEESCPQFRGVDSEIWIGFIKRDINNWREKLVEPSNPHSWGKVYRKLVRGNKKEEEADMEILKQQLAQCEKDKMSNTSTEVDQKYLKMPRGGWWGSGSSARESAERSRPGPLALKLGSRTKMVNSNYIIEKARREASQASLFRNKGNALAVPTHLLNSKSTGVKHVSQGMLEDHQRKQRPQQSPPQPPRAAVNVRQVPVQMSSTQPTNHASNTSLLDREQRLRDLPSGRKPAPRETPASSTDQATKNTFLEREQRLRNLTSGKKELTAESRAPREMTPSSSNKRKFDDSDLDSDEELTQRPTKSSRPKTSLVPSSATSTRPQVPTDRPKPKQPLIRTVKVSQLTRGRSPVPAPEASAPEASAPEASTPEAHKPHRSQPLKHTSISPPNSRTASPAGVKLQRKKKEVDIFMRPKKRPEARLF